MTIKELILKFLSWTGTVVEYRRDGIPNSRSWATKGLEYEEDFTFEAMQKFFDRTKLNAEYVKRRKETNPKAKVPHAYLQTEINMIYSFHKSFASRQKSRLQYYRDDLAQKDYHTSSAINIALGKFESNKEKAEKNP